MTESYIQDLFAERIGGKRYGKDTAIYKFEKIKRAKRAAKEANPDTELFDLGVGEPDAMADAGIIETLYAEARKPDKINPPFSHTSATMRELWSRYSFRVKIEQRFFLRALPVNIRASRLRLDLIGECGHLQYQLQSSHHSPGQ